MIVALAVSTALLLPVSTPPNATAYSTGLLEQRDFFNRRISNWFAWANTDYFAGVAFYMAF